MNRRTQLAVAMCGVAALIALTTVAVWLATRDSYEDKVHACASAVATGVEAGTTGLGTERPDECTDVTHDDYTVIVMDAATREAGVYDLLNIE